MVLTDLLLQGASPVARRFFNVLAEEPETVAMALVPRVRAVQVGSLVQLAQTDRLWCRSCLGYHGEGHEVSLVVTVDVLAGGGSRTP
jgi:hypothetical protein